MGGDMRSRRVGAQVEGEMFGQILNGRFRRVICRITTTRGVSNALFGARDDNRLVVFGL